MSNESKKIVRTLTGKVVSIKMDKTIVVLVTRRWKHPVGKYVSSSTKLHVHDADNQCRLNDTVLIGECRPISKTKSWALLEVVSQSKALD